MADSTTYTVALVGNPNAGKSTLFNALSGLRQRTGNYPGVTVEMKKGTVSVGNATLELIDLPGTYSLAARSLDELVAVDLLLGHQPGEKRPDVIVAIADACNLDRHLYLATQLCDLGTPVVLALSMMDVAESQQIRIQVQELGRRLNVPVVPIQAHHGKGLQELKQAIVDAATRGTPPTGPTMPAAFQDAVHALAQQFNGKYEPFLLQRLLLDVGGSTEARLIQQEPTLQQRLPEIRQSLQAAGCPVPAIEPMTRYSWIRKLLAEVVQRSEVEKVTWNDRLDRVLTHRIWGTLIFLSLMFVMFFSIFEWAGPLMDFISDGKDWLAARVEANMEPGVFRSLLIGGVIDGVGGVVVFLPQILILFAFIAVLEDCGYMSRAAFVMDKLMSRCGLNGKSFIPLLSSLACAVPGVMATRVIENRRDRLATILVAPLMSCSARLPVYLLVTGTLFTDPKWLAPVVMFAMYLLGLIIAPIVALVFKRTILKGATPVFVMEMPPLRWPLLRNVIRRMVEAGWAFLKRAGTFILASMIIVWALLYFPNGDYETRLQEQAESIELLTEQRDALPEGESPERLQLESQIEDQESARNRLYAEWKEQTYLGRVGHALEPVFLPLGWDWKVGMAALASFPAREVIVGTMGILYQQGDVDPGVLEEEDNQVASRFRNAILSDWKAHPVLGPYPTLTGLSLMVFFALCCQCVSTLAVIRRETQSWTWPVVTFVYMTTLAYVAALLVFQIGKLFV
ncbi:ferrous iron transport protein B [Tuwongella immobilis]|uniref:Ferrous iron transport protein B n=1 Tax=Tuwongella immobilis TaxID=692036 RepID=A0A6C2YQ66_9BACT|nr:ferrous iron transport protein B [Tuwongella immobilis]VIP03032.1 ferrous iron transport protein b : Ferrous iron transport protein B OS=Pirellula staleyi (strain ATCC 27377 / DSM 6068 / ICPB 4128) GN=Psta_2393 PE=4 SV=1: FeoB_N: Gate: FeoB_C: Gate [Tuwongella immobilis]VTS03184.1 ferrous iron transport protein b : Ferrous iron transport protein B OS=Pirellula staleyi (strain ATCC 27377 / DSM 6068 / ICPB 4128) GN=Psta_2393 PE=4 SV=1: FeoB_N: Gate: FeoB_C: Gate [Tuwongella immobilis]